MTSRWPLAVLAMLLAVIAQASGLDRVPLPSGSRIDVPLLMVAGIGLVVAADKAPLAAFLLGLIVDLFQFGPFGIHALVYCLAAWALVNARVRVLEAGTSFRTAQGAGAVVAVTALTWFVGGVFGQDAPSLDQWFPRLAWSARYGAVLVHPVTRLVRWLFSDRSLMSSDEPVRAG